jgi:hypothetical protein
VDQNVAHPADALPIEFRQFGAALIDTRFAASPIASMFRMIASWSASLARKASFPPLANRAIF